MRINHNISALRANGQLKDNNAALSKSLEKLSSGYRINRASDDAAGMAISQKMKTQIRGLEMASRNGADGISVIQTAEGALSEMESMLQRMRELAVQAANDTNTLDDRKAIQDEVNQLNEEILRLSDTTEFNTKSLLDGTIAHKSHSSNTKVEVLTTSDNVEVKAYDFVVNQEARQAQQTGSAITNTLPITVLTEGTITINGESITVKPGETHEQVIHKLRDLCDVVGVNLTSTTGNITDPNAVLKFETVGYGADESIVISCNNNDLADKLGINGILGLANKKMGTDAKVTLDQGVDKPFSTTATVTYKGNIATISDSNGFEMKVKIKEGASAAGGQVKISMLDAGPMNLQIGANEGQLMEIIIPKVSPETLGITNINLCTEPTAQKAISNLDEAIRIVSSVRGKLGAYQNRLDHAIASLDEAAENLTEALSRIEDVDMAEEMTVYTQNQVLTQANTSMLAQANERPQTILTLLQG